MSRTLPLRRWLVLALAVVFLLPTMLTATVVYHFLGQPVDGSALAEQLLRDGVDRWDDPAWQVQVAAELAPKHTDVILLEGDREIFRSSPDPLADLGDQGSRTVHRLELTSGSTPRTAYIYTDSFTWPPQGRYLIVPLVALLSLLATLGGTGWFLGRMVTRPLAATGAATRRIAAGDLDVALPSSRVREVAEVNTAVESMSAELRELLEQQARLEQERRLFIGAVAHDLRTPLFSLRGSLEGLEKGLADTAEKRTRYIAIAQEKAAALERLIADLFDYTRLEYLDQSPVRAPLDIARLLRRLVDGLQPQAAAKDVRLTFAEPAEPCVVEGDSHLLTRALENLLDNALRHTPSGGSIRVECQAEPGRVSFAVADTGPGIPAHDLPHLFAPMYRGETSRNRRTGGAGLGLTIARRILLAHGGDLRAGNGASGGAVFTGSLPSSQRAVGSEPATPLADDGRVAGVPR